jgi:hypothetical protein
MICDKCFCEINPDLSFDRVTIGQKNYHALCYNQVKYESLLEKTSKQPFGIGRHDVSFTGTSSIGSEGNLIGPNHRGFDVKNTNDPRLPKARFDPFGPGSGKPDPDDELPPV